MKIDLWLNIHVSKKFKNAPQNSTYLFYSNYGIRNFFIFRNYFIFMNYFRNLFFHFFFSHNFQHTINYIIGEKMVLFGPKNTIKGQPQIHGPPQDTLVISNKSLWNWKTMDVGAGQTVSTPVFRLTRLTLLVTIISGKSLVSDWSRSING